MVAWGDIFKPGSMAEQLLMWQVAGQLISAVIGPELVAAQSEIWSGNVEASGGALHAPLSPSDLADMVVKGIIAQSDGESGATMSGVNSADFDHMVQVAGDPPGLETVLQMFRRGLIEWDDVGPEVPSVVRAIRSGRLYDIWTTPIQGMLSVPISPADAVEATLRGQRPQADMQNEAYANGIDPERFQILLDTAGNPPAPGELRELLNRGLIALSGIGPSETTFQQGIYEGDNKDKWWELSAKLGEYRPPPRAISTLQTHGVITQAQAAQLYQDNGLTPEMAGIYAASAVAVRVTAHTQVTEANILKLYADQLIDEVKATAMLADIGYPADVATFLLELTDYDRAAAAYNSAVSRVGSLYVGHHINQQAAVEALTKLDVPADARSHLLQTWNAEVAANVKTLTQAEITGAWEYGVIDQTTAQSMLQSIGYTPFDAWVLISVKAKGPQGSPPAGGPGTDPSGALT